MPQPDNQSIADTFFGTLLASTRPGHTRTVPLTKHRETCRKGNPFPLIAAQWPMLVVTDPAEVEFFEGDSADSDNPVLRMDPWQRLFLKSLFDPTVGELFMKGCTGAGKGFTMGVAANLLFEVHDPCRISVTSDSFSNAKDNLFGEILKWRKLMVNPVSGRVSERRIASHERHYIRIHNPSKYGGGESFSGAHSEGLTVYFFDEASAVPEIHYTNCLKNAKKVIAASNPRITEGWFRDGYRPLRNAATKAQQDDEENTTGFCVGRLGRRLCMTIAGSDCSNVIHGRLKEPVAPLRGIKIGNRDYGPAELIDPEDYQKVKNLVPGQIDLAQYQSILDTSKEEWEKECYAHARFPSEDPVRQAILASWLPRHVAAHPRSRKGIPPIKVECFGLDVARSLSGDGTELSAGGVKGCAKIHKWQTNSNTEHVRRVLSIANDVYGIDLRDGRNPICIDYGGGYGAGVGDRLKEIGVWVIEFIPAGRATVEPGVFINQRVEWYMLLSARLDPNGNWPAHPWALPPIDELLEELVAPLKTPARGGTMLALEPKDAIRKRLGRSPDKADSLVCLYRAVFQRFKLMNFMSKKVSLIAERAGELTAEDLDKSQPTVEPLGDDELPPPRMVDEPVPLSQQAFEALGGVIAEMSEREEDKRQATSYHFASAFKQEPPTPAEQALAEQKARIMRYFQDD